MHTLLITVAGLILIWLSYLISTRRKIRFLRFFPVIWFVICVIHLIMGVNEGYALSDELMVHSIVFGVPVVAWLLLTQYLKRKNYSL